jgi:diamine N-acetyltransferase
MFTLRRASKNDISTIKELASGTWYATYGEILSKEQQDFMFEMMYSEESLKTQIEEKGHQFYIVFNDEKPRGYLSIEVESDNLFHIQKLYVLPDNQKTGLGRYLIEKAFEICCELAGNKPYSVELNVNRYNKAVTFYQKMGMYIKTEGDFAIGNGYYMNDYIMRKDFNCENK